MNVGRDARPMTPAGQASKSRGNFVIGSNITTLPATSSAAKMFPRPAPPTIGSESRKLL